MAEVRTVKQQYIVQFAKKSFLSDQCQPDARSDSEMGLVLSRPIEELTTESKGLTVKCSDLCEQLMKQPEWDDICDLCCTCLVFFVFFKM